MSLDLPEHGRLDLPLAGVGARSAAALADLGLLILAAAVLGTALLVSIDSGPLDPTVTIGAAVALAALVPVLGPLLFELAWRGQTPGKRLLGLRVISEDGAPAAPWQLLIRNVLRLVDFMPVGYLAGLSSMFISWRAQRLGDLAAGTLVIREDPRALAEASAVTGAMRVPAELHGIPDAILRGADRLLDPSRPLEPSVRIRRMAEVAALVRRHRPDLASESDPLLWSRLARALGRMQ